MSRNWFRCPECERPVWLPAEAPPGTPCPHCGHLLGAASFDWSRVEMPAPWDLANGESIDLRAMVPSVAALGRVDESIARDLCVFPVDSEGEKLVLAVPARVQSEVLDKIRFVLNCDIWPVLAPKAEIEAAIDLWYR